MKRIEYRDVCDKTKWPQGEWDDEPDKIQWLDEATGLPCLIVRGPVGALCGYVAVPTGHPLHGKGYNECLRDCNERWCGHSLESTVDVHGGLTFSGACTSHAKEDWEILRKKVIFRSSEAQIYPEGDIARMLKERWPYDYEAWITKIREGGVCHVVEAGEPDDVWWFGFDCAHCDDFAPGANWSLGEAHYRNVAYVTEECQKLALQLQRTTEC